jgi:membrane associated rhomboid family serine protease
MRERIREPIFNIPAVVLTLLALMALVHAARSFLSPEAEFEFVARFGFVAARFGFLLDQRAVLDHLTRVAQASQEQGEVGQFFLTYAPPRDLWFTPLSYAFLHGDWTHLIFNGVWLAAFGSPVARRFGGGRFLALGALGAIGGAFFYMAFHLTELGPLVGASAAISAYMGAASRFVFEPGAFARADLGEPARRPELASLQCILANRSTLAFIGFWFVSNLLFGIGGQDLGMSNAPVAWEAHIGGFLLGLALAPLFDQRSKSE